MQAFAEIAAQNEADAQRFIELGADPKRVHVCGSVKFDVRIPASVREHGELLRTAWGTGRHVWVAASTHPGEDELLLDVHQAILEKYPDALLVLTPRHPERFDAVAALVESRGFGYCRRSKTPVCPASPASPGTGSLAVTATSVPRSARHGIREKCGKWDGEINYYSLLPIFLLTWQAPIP